MCINANTMWYKYKSLVNQMASGGVFPDPKHISVNLLPLLDVYWRNVA